MRQSFHSVALASVASIGLAACGALTPLPESTTARRDAAVAIADRGLLESPLETVRPVDPDSQPRGSLSWAIAAATTSSPAVREALYGVVTSSAAVRETNSAFLPDVSLNGAVGGTDNSGVTQIQRYGVLGLGGGLTLFDGGARDARSDYARFKLIGSMHTAAERLQAVGLSVTEAYLDVLRHREVLAIAEENVRTHEGFEQMVQRRIREGQSSDAELGQVRARLENAKARRSEAATALADARARFERFVGSEPNDLRRPDRLSISRDVALLRELGTKHPALLVAKSEVQAAIAALRAVDAERGGSLGVQLSNAGFTWLMAARDPLTLGLAVLQATIPLSDAWKGVPRIERAVAQVRVAVARAQDLERQIDLAISLAFNASVGADQQRQHALAEARHLERVGRAFLAQYEAGSRALIEVLNAQAERALGASRAVTASYAADFARHRIAAAIGTHAANLGYAEWQQRKADDTAFQNAIDDAALVEQRGANTQDR